MGRGDSMIGPRQFLLGGIALFALTGIASAADMPIKGPVYTKAPQAWSWEGQYIGIHGGYAWGSDDATFGAISNEFSTSGAFGGFQFGYNHHLTRNWVIGYEVDVSFGDLNDTRQFAVALTNQIDHFGTARTRLGYAQGPWLIYGTAGLAWASSDFVAVGVNIERWNVGYVVGAGVEYAFAPNWSLKLEYLFADLGSNDTSLFGGTTINNDLQMSSLRLGLNYRFANWASPAVAAAYPTKAPAIAVGWTGAYVGVHAGYGWGSYEEATNAGVLDSLDPKGGFGGIQSGFNWQLSRNWLVGIEADSSWGSLRAGPSLIPNGNVDIDAMGTVRARLGYTMNNVMIYGTGGLAWAHVDYVNTVGDVRDQYHLGWTAGVGVEYAINARWTAKLEYLYVDFGTISENTGPVSFASLDVHTIKLGLNYRASLLGLLFNR
jgi:outer membrane immunogenic protein